ncbi:MAG: peptidylprolyl isomerase [Clostridia bacterium]|nr:peptidylprolyl isomerase [Clostridia bacterium]
MKKIIAILICIAMAFTFFSCDAGKSSDETAADTTGTVVNTPQIYDSEKPVITIGDATITLGEYNLFFRTLYLTLITYYQNNYGEQYESYLLSQEGFDVNKSLKEQECPYYEGTYYDYFTSIVKKNCTEIAVFLDYAYKNGIELTDEEKENNEAQVQSVIEDAKEYSSSLSDYYLDEMKITTEDVIRSYYTKTVLASKASDAYAEDHPSTDEEIKAEFEANPINYSVVSYLAYTMQVDEDSTETTVHKYADELAASETPEEFTEYVKNYYYDVLYPDVEDLAEFDPDSLIMSNIPYSEGLEFLDWLFKEAKVGECYASYSNEDKVCTVYMLTSAPKLNDYTSKTVRHILLMPSSFDNDDAKCYAEVERIYDLYKADPTEENFAALANEYSEDPDYEYDENGNPTSTKTEKTSGGLIENIELGKTVKPFERWAFDEARKPGDTDIVKSSYGYHIMYFVGDGIEITTGTDNIKTALYQKNFDAYVESLDITYDEEAIANILT